MTQKRLARSLSMLCGIAAMMLVTAGCTGGTQGNAPQAGPPAGDTTSAAAVWRDFVSCAREHGQQNMPDPVVDGHGVATFPAVEGFDEKRAYQEVRGDCGAILDSLPAGVNPLVLPSFTSEQLQALRRYVQCMRDNGLPQMPDPGPNGELIDPPGAELNGPLRQARDDARGVCDHLLTEFQ
jgi:hypothetical protein